MPDELHVPHLLLHERAFVLRPLADVAPELRASRRSTSTVREMLDEVEDEHEVRPADYPRGMARDAELPTPSSSATRSRTSTRSTTSRCT